MANSETRGNSGPIIFSQREKAATLQEIEAARAHLDSLEKHVVSTKGEVSGRKKAAIDSLRSDLGLSKNPHDTGLPTEPPLRIRGNVSGIIDALRQHRAKQGSSEEKAS